MLWFIEGSPDVSTHSRLKAAGASLNVASSTDIVSTHSRLKAAGKSKMKHCLLPQQVSTHSRLKAAGFMPLRSEITLQRFNTQPPEGGWKTNF